MQMALFDSGTVSKAIVHLPVDQLQLSSFNPRRQRPAQHVQKLAERITRNGFEITRAPWGYRNGKGYEIFAGGTRLEAARLAGLTDIPVVLHSGYTEAQIIKLADEDNENDEYHAPVSIVDTWLHYKYLSDNGWTQQQIADAKGVSQSTVKFRLQYADLSESVHAAISTNQFITEAHAREFLQLVQCTNLTPWLDRDGLMAEIIEARLAKSDKPTAKQFAADIALINEAIDKARQGLAQLDEAHQRMFLDGLTNARARTSAQVHGIYANVLSRYQAHKKHLADEARAQADAVESERIRIERKAQLEANRQKTLAKIKLGDARTEQIPAGTRLLLTDPPYGMEFQSNRRTVSARADKIANDDESAFDLLREVLKLAYPRMADDSVLLVWSGWRYECQFRTIIESCGFTIRNSIIWNKPNHGSGDLEGSYAPKHERIIYAVKGNPKMNKRHDDVLTGREFMGTEHPTEKPLDLLRLFIQTHTNEGDIVADPFAGVGSTLVAAYDTGRDMWGCEIDSQWHAVATQQIYNKMMTGEVS